MDSMFTQLNLKGARMSNALSVPPSKPFASSSSATDGDHTGAYRRAISEQQFNDDGLSAHKNIVAHQKTMANLAPLAISSESGKRRIVPSTLQHGAETSIYHSATELWRC